METQINLCRWLNGEEVDPGQPPESAEQLRQFYEWLGERSELRSNEREARAKGALCRTTALVAK